jgi:ParB family transcriptional regulator, chromosome partitioning protein
VNLLSRGCLKMNKRKKFTIADDINRGITEVINAVNDNVGSFRYEVIALSRIEIDPNNPRELVLTDKDISFGIDGNDAHATRKKREKEDLEGLAHTIKHNGVINPIVVYKHEDKYRIVAGERRFLAAHLAERNDIHARIIDKKPDEIKLRVLQWIENNERKDLSLNERLKNLEVIIEAYNKKHDNDVMAGETLRKLTGLSKPQAHFYLTVLNDTSDLRKNIEEGTVNNLQKAVLIAGITDHSLRERILQACASGNSIKFLKELVAKSKNETKADLKKGLARGRGRTVQHVNLGRTKNIDAIRKIIKIVVSHPNYNKHAERFNKMDSNEYKKISFAFQSLLAVLEEECNSRA